MSHREHRARAFTFDPRFHYLPEGDRFLLEPERPLLRFNLIGAGVMGQEHLRITHLEGRAVVHGVYDPNPRSIATAQAAHAAFPRAGRAAEPLVVYESLEAAASDPAADALIIATPNYTHRDVLRAAAPFGKPILLEKPIATTLADAYAIVALAEAHPAPVQLGLQYRFKSIYTEALAETQVRRSIGQVHMIQIAEHRIPFLDKVGQWNKFSEYSGNTLIEKCCHYFDLMNLFAGARPVSVYASGGQAVNFRDFTYAGRASDIYDHAFVTVTYANGVRGQFTLCMFAPMFYEALTLFGDAGRLHAYEQQDFAGGLELESHLEVTCGEDRVSRRTRPGYPAWIEKSGHSGATFYEHVRFVDRVLAHREGAAAPQPAHGPAAATAEEGLWSIIVAAAAQESIATGGVVTVADLLDRVAGTETRSVSETRAFPETGSVSETRAVSETGS
jgi:predicted dehydrogenase